ncbi:MAG: hemolysin family protein [Lactobacillus sp.]|nr:hemolysin family protein [Lactobacillus sp.]
MSTGPEPQGLIAKFKAKFDKKPTTLPKDHLAKEISKFYELKQINENEYSMLRGLLSFQDKTAREVMVPRPDAFMVDSSVPFSENLDEILREPYSRVPVFEGDKDHVIGIIHIRSVLRKARQIGFDKIKYDDIMLEPLFASENIELSDLLVEMQHTQRQMAILLDEYGGVTGLATIEDLIEEIVGEIDDEVDKTQVLYNQINDHQYVIYGKMPLDDFNDTFGTHLEMEDVDTIAGYMIFKLGVIPTKGEKLSVPLDNGMILTTRRMKGSRLITVLLTMPKEEEQDEDDATRRS